MELLLAILGAVVVYFGGAITEKETNGEVTKMITFQIDDKNVSISKTD